MPLFDFRCDECKEVFELLVPAASSRPKCPGCNGPLERLLPDRLNFELKGDCWTRDNWQDTKRAEKKRKGVL
jgi:putative FmdB family regulatory protein